MPAGLMANAPTAPFPSNPDRGRMQRDRMARLHELMTHQGLDALVLLGNSNVAYATGFVWPLSDAGRATFERPVAVVLADDAIPHLFSPLRTDDRFDMCLPGDHVHGPVFLEFDEGAEHFVDILAGLLPSGSTIALDEWTHPMWRVGSSLFSNGVPTNAGQVIGQAKLIKSPDEVAFLREGLRITEVAAAEVHRRIAPGVRQSDLSAVFLGAIFDAGAEANVMDPIWQVMPSRVGDGPWTTTGDIACPLLTTERPLDKGDVLWVDVSATYGGFHSDFGRTWIVGREPDARQRAQFTRWQEILRAVLDVTRAGATNADLTAAAREASGGGTPWLPHFYLGHGLGIDSAEMPFVGSDIGQAFDESYQLQAGMTLVLEPIVWEDGACGYRAEEVLLVTDDGWVPLTDYPYDPFSAL
jgi:Xaa-Pro dipeptidase